MSDEVKPNNIYGGMFECITNTSADEEMRYHAAGFEATVGKGAENNAALLYVKIGGKEYKWTSHGWAHVRPELGEPPEYIKEAEEETR